MRLGLGLGLTRPLGSGGITPQPGAETSFYPSGAYMLPVANRAQLQSELDARGTLILDAGDYSAGGQPDIVLKSGQRLIGVPGKTITPKVIVRNGAIAAQAKGIRNAGANVLEFEAGTTPTVGCTFEMITGNIRGVGCTLENNRFVSVIGVLLFDLTSGGRLRNNLFYRFVNQNAGSSSQACFRILGNTSKNSWGNKLIGFNALTPFGQQFDVRNNPSFRLIGFDSESYADPDGTQKPCINSSGNDDFKAISMVGALSGQPVAQFDEARVELVNPALNASSWSTLNQYFLNATVLAMAAILRHPDDTAQWNDSAPTATRITVPPHGDQVSLRNTKPATLTGTDATRITDMLVNDPAGQTFAVWPYYAERTVPDPLGPTWNVGLAGQPDDSAALQALADAAGVGGVVRLNRIYYIDTRIRWKTNQTWIGTGKSVCGIVCKTAGLNVFDDTDLDTTNLSSPNNSIIDMFLQGGTNGVRQAKADVQMAYAYFAHVVFRGFSNAGYSLDQSYAMDNVFWSHVDFVDCGTGFKTRGTGINTGPTSGYVDKTHFYRCQKIGCGYGKDMQNTRASNLNFDFECLYKDNTSGAFTFAGGSHNYPHEINCVFQNNGGAIAMNSDNVPIYYVRCKVIGGVRGIGNAMFAATGYFEGMEFSRGPGGGGQILKTPPVLGDYRNSAVAVIQNSNSTDMPIGTFDPAANTTVQLINSLMAAADAAYNNPIVSVWCDTKGTPNTADDTFSKINPWLAGTVNAGTKYLRDRVT